MMNQQVPFKITIRILPNGLIQQSIESERNHGTPLEGLQLFHKLEPQIIKFKKAVHKVVSAYSEPGNPGKHPDEKKYRRTK